MNYNIIFIIYLLFIINKLTKIIELFRIISMKKLRVLKLILVNMFTLIRLIGAVSLPLVYIKYGVNVCAFVTIILFLTDAIDGFLARKLKCSTFFGSSMDAFSDKLLNTISFILLGFTYNVMFLPIIAEVSILIISYATFRNGGNVQSTKIGKIKTIIMDICVIASFLLLSLRVVDIDFVPLFIINKTPYIINILGCICTIAEVIALSDYKKKYLLTRSVPKTIKINYKELKKKKFKEVIRDAFDTEYYLKHKDESIMKQFYK